MYNISQYHITHFLNDVDLNSIQPNIFTFFTHYTFIAHTCMSVILSVFAACLHIRHIYYFTCGNRIDCITFHFSTSPEANINKQFCGVECTSRPYVIICCVN